MAVNSGYISSIPGILNIAGMVLSMLAFICAIVPYWTTHYGGGWNQFAAMITFIVLTIIFLVHLLDYNGRVPSYALFHLVAHAVLVLFNFIAFIVACVLAGRFRAYTHPYFNYPALVVATIFFAILLAILVVSLFFSFRNFRAGTSAETVTSSKTTTVTTTTTVPA